MGLENIDCILRNPVREDKRKLPDKLILGDLKYYHAHILPTNFSREKFLELIPSALPSYTYGYVWHHIPFGGIDPKLGKYAVILKDKFVTVLSESELNGEHILQLVNDIVQKSKN